MMEDKHLFDALSATWFAHRLYSTLNKKGVRKDKDETHGIPIQEFVGLKSKMYSLIYEENKKLCEKKTAKGLPENLNDDSFIDSRYPSLIILDDLMRDVTNSKDVCELFVEGSHHRNLSVACILQNAFSKGKESRTMSINSQYIVLFKKPT
ncbi:unnamed protein product [Mytilus edulis]|uniref:Uncharacterized protein n=1 Tax=Mytilus edulis TaxID=6550 RepID=A0A8S3QNE4_MYTED|nr:unnamed protein product [Mytilus edulis]